MKLNFYYAGMLNFGYIILYQYDEKLDERWHTPVLSKMYPDKPFSLDEIKSANCLCSYNISKEFSNELELKNWILDNNYKVLKDDNSYAIYEKTIITVLGGNTSLHKMYAIWEDK